MKDSTTLVDESVQALQQCGDALAEISQTCCLPERSQNMKEAQILIDNAVSSAKASRSDLKKAHKCIQNVGAIRKQDWIPVRPVLHANARTSVSEHLQGTDGGEWQHGEHDISQ
jgi:hypothetical protein